MKSVAHGSGVGGLKVMKLLVDPDEKTREEVCKYVAGIFSQVEERLLENTS